jgi:hypothetical protein
MESTTAIQCAPQATLSAVKRIRFPKIYLRKDTRTSVLRLVYGPQSKFSSAIIVAPGLAFDSPEAFDAAWKTLAGLLPVTAYDRERCVRILGDFDRLRRAGKGER